MEKLSAFQRWYNYMREQNGKVGKFPLTCGSCPIGKTQRIVGNGITEPPYLQVIRCPYDDKHYKCLDDECTQQAQLEHSAKKQTEQYHTLMPEDGYCSRGERRKGEPHE